MTHRRQGHLPGAGGRLVLGLLRRAAAQEHAAGHRRRARSRAYFSPNGDGKRDVNQISIRLRVADDATVDVVNLDGDRVKRLADNAPMQPVPAAAARVGRHAPTPAGACRTASTGCGSSLRDEGRSATVQKTTTVDTKAPRSEVCIGVQVLETTKRMGNVISQGDRADQDLHPRRVAASATHFTRLAHRRGQAARWSRSSRSRARRTPQGVGRARRRQAAADRARTSSRPGCATRRATSASRRPSSRSGAIPGRPGLTVRGLAAQPPLRPVTGGPAGRVPRRRARRRVPLARAPGGRLGGAQARLGDRAACSPSARPPARRASTCSSCARGAGTRRCRSSSRPRSARACSWSCRRSRWLGTDKVDDRPFDGLPNTLTDGGTVRWPRAFVGTDGLPAGLVGGRAAARLPRPPADPLRPHERPRPRPHAQPARLGPPGRAVRRLRALDHAHAGQAAAPLRDRRRARRAVRRRLDAPRRAPARATPTARPGRSRARRSRRPPTRSARGSASRARCRRRRRCRSSRATPQYGLMEGANDLPGFKVLEEASLVDRQGEPGVRRAAADARGGGRGALLGQGPARDPPGAERDPARQGRRHPRRAAGVDFQAR